MFDSPGDIRHKILAHRGLWNENTHPNSLKALTSAWEEGFGIETDLRDYQNQIVISHDSPNGDEAKLQTLLLELHSKKTHPDQVFAANIKSDGLEKLIVAADWGNINYFAFDMSFPTLYKFWNLNIPISVRLSEFEVEDLKLSSYFSITRYWLDLFESDWFIQLDTLPWLVPDSEVFVVSPELHGRDPLEVWKWSKHQINNGVNIKICTDKPFELEGFLNE